ncbi:MAG: HRDC domain-containing protein [Gammaproteobacteria bacterium]|nr:HRDC domain-containing protein [Gammaproteobacteria bacterium]
MAALGDPGRFLPDPDALWQKIKYPAEIEPVQLAVLRTLAAWRELEARRRDLPRGFVIEDKDLISLAMDLPTSDGELNINGSTRRRHGTTLLNLIREGRESDPENWPQVKSKTDDWREQKALTDQLAKAARRVARSTGVAPELLAPRKLLAQVASRIQAGQAEPWPATLTGWRLELLADALLAAANGQQRGSD